MVSKQLVTAVQPVPVPSVHPLSAAGHAEHALLLKNVEFLHSFIVHRLVTLFADHDAVFHEFTFVVLLLHVASHDVLPVPLVVLPFVHAVHADLPVVSVYDPCAHAVALVALAGQYAPAGHIVQLTAVLLA